LEGGANPPWILKYVEKKVAFLVSSGKKSNFTTFGPPWKNLGKLP